MCLYVINELKRMMNGQFQAELKYPSNDALIIIHVDIDIIGLKQEIVVNFDEYNNPNDIITDIIREIKKKVDRMIFA